MGASYDQTSFLAKASVKPPQKLIIFIFIFFSWIKVSKNILFNYENSSTGQHASQDVHPAEPHHPMMVISSASFLAEISVSSPRKVFIFII